jgi:Rad4 beta-hairpin domain 1
MIILFSEHPVHIHTLLQQVSTEPIPDTVAAIKQSKLYCTASQLKKNECIHPSAKPCGVVKGHSVSIIAIK